MIHELLINAPASVKTVPIYLYHQLSDVDLTPFEHNWVHQAASRQPDVLPIPDETGALSKVLVRFDAHEEMFSLGSFYTTAPQGIYYIANDDLSDEAIYQLLLGFALGAYQYNEFKASTTPNVQLLFPKTLDRQKLLNEIEAHYITRTLINRPPNHLNPVGLTQYIQTLFDNQPVTVKVIEGDDLLTENFPLIHHVGNGSDAAPRLVEITYGDPMHKSLTLIGKGVTFDSGGLDLKPANGMRLMKKDMGGAAHAIALAQWIIKSKWHIHLRVLLPIVENSVSSTAMRPGDVIKARNGLTVEIDNTDAEGRLILADAISYASEVPTDAIVNFATLTGAARVALGPEVPALFATDDSLANAILEDGQTHDDALWRMPLHTPYNEWIESKYADILNSSTQPYGGSITAALFLTHFLSDNVPFAHIDVMAWNVRNRKGRPMGGEAMGLRATYYGLAHHFGMNV
ncbi:aminopeptidase [Wohlfahrtiimonas chitiniclastica]|uniref:leucyl aminopeptidase family protein n=1 Tax=Wohlfahrtiimonas chitiniclastica TaxID=400946 RepID=UPI000B97D4F5|nr:leucyl aminopeptidase family protein [Wohlfahrtiimonas chitiniclastica]OYQ90321.1 aminopeptidase [Wohlfahrtiimonas chitiniclastica]